MPAPYHDDIELLSVQEVERVYRRTDELKLHRDWVIVPLNCAKTATERVLPDGKILLRAPGGESFGPWLEELPVRLAEMGLSRTPRTDGDDPNRHLTGRSGSRVYGTRGYLQCQPDLDGVDDYARQSSPVDGGSPMDSTRPLPERVLPDNGKREPGRGAVIAVGPGSLREER